MPRAHYAQWAHPAARMRPPPPPSPLLAWPPAQAAGVGLSVLNTVAMRARAAAAAGALALGAVGGGLLGGCGGTQTVSVSAPPPASATTGTHASASRTASTPAHTTTAPVHTTTAPAAGPTAQSTSTTRTAPAPAFVGTGGQSAEARANTEANAAADVLTAHGYTPVDISDYHAAQTLRVLIGTRTGAAAGTERAFFFLGNRYLGTDAATPSGSIAVVSQSDTEVALAYALYRPHDPVCCPSGGQAVVHFQLDDGALTPLQTLPPATSAGGLSRQ
jgi:hypothetical protein